MVVLRVVPTPVALIAIDSLGTLQAQRTVVLVNCGACEDLRQLLHLPLNTRAIVVDSHRPIHHR